MAHPSRALPEFAPVSSLRSETSRHAPPSRTGAGAVVRGRAAVIELRPLLVALARITGQAGALDQIELLVKHPTALRKSPCLVLVGVPEGIRPQDVRAEDLEGAALLYEYLVAGLPTGVYATDDVSGERTVLARQAVRAHVAEQACRILIAHGAAVCLASVTDIPAPGPRRVFEPPQNGVPCNMAVRVRTQGRDLELGSTLDETMAAFGKNTRRNFRRYRHRVEAELGAVFVPFVRIGPEEFLELSRCSTNPVPEEDAAWRYHFATSSAQRLFAGMRDRDGRWLSLIAGTRYSDHTYIEWQVNREGLPKYSLSTVMRSFLLEYESSIGTHKLLFKGGTPHSMGLSLTPAETLDVLVVRRGLRGWLLRKLSRWIFPQSNFLARALGDHSLAWIA